MVRSSTLRRSGSESIFLRPKFKFTLEERRNGKEIEAEGWMDIASMDSNR